MKDQKKTSTKELIDRAKRECGIRQSDQEEEAKKAAEASIHKKVSSDFIPDSLLNLLGQEVIDNLRSTSSKKNQKGITEVKKIFSKATVNINKQKAKQLFEPISILMRMLLSQQASSMYLDALKLLKYIVSVLAPQLDSLDLNILIGSFVGMIVSTVTTNMRI